MRHKPAIFDFHQLAAHGRETWATRLMSVIGLAPAFLVAGLVVWWMLAG